MNFLVIIPTFNERENLPELVRRLDAAGARELLFVDDHSTDGTAEWIKALADRRPGSHLLERPGKQGLGTAYTTGFKWALARGYEAVFEMDADLSHDPAEIPKFIDRIEKGDDVVIGSRYLGGIRIINWPLGRLILSQCAAWYTQFWTRMPLTDPTSGFKCLRHTVLKALDLDRVHSNGYAFQIEINYAAWRKGFRLAEVPIVFTERMGGTSKMNRAIVREAIGLVPRLRFLGR